MPEFAPGSGSIGAGFHVPSLRMKYSERLYLFKSSARFIDSAERNEISCSPGSASVNERYPNLLSCLAQLIIVSRASSASNGKATRRLGNQVA